MQSQHTPSAEMAHHCVVLAALPQKNGGNVLSQNVVESVLSPKFNAALHCPRYTQWRRRALAKQRHKGPGRLLLGLLLPVLAGFVIAKTGLGSRSTKQAVNDVSHKVRLHKIRVIVKDRDTHEADADEQAEDVSSKTQPSERKPAAPPPDRKFLGIF